jgi:tripeptide aminopeptidase
LVRSGHTFIVCRRQPKINEEFALAFAPSLWQPEGNERQGAGAAAEAADQGTGLPMTGKERRMTASFDVSGTTVVERFLEYVKMDTQARENVEDYPSSPGQLELGRKLVAELEALGLRDVEMDEHGYVMGTLPSNLPPAEAEKIPVIGFLAHMDTYHEVSGKDVKPIIHRNYQGGDLVLGEVSGEVIREADNPQLRDFIGKDIITSDGTTLLGADDKAGIAEIMAALEYMTQHPEFKRGTIRVGFTPDEEVGLGTKYFDVTRFGARYAYTLDGGYPGEVENETFCADTAIVTCTGKDVHPGYAKGKMVNAVRAAAYFVGLLREDALPETTAGRQGYIHPYQVEGNVSEAKVVMLLRDFEVEGLKEKAGWLDELVGRTRDKFPGLEIALEIKESYRNMVYKLMEEPRVVEYAIEAVERCGLEPLLRAIRGGTDGARLSYMGLPTPNLFAGGINFHSKHEWVVTEVMEKAVETILHLTQIWRERSV